MGMGYCHEGDGAHYSHSAAMLSDNPMQSELACIVGLAGKFFVDAVG